MYVLPEITTERYSIANADRVIQFLISMNIDKELIISFAYLILFDFKTVKNAFHYQSNRAGKSMPKDYAFFQNLIDYLQKKVEKYSFLN